jgi:hypothetical protein
MQQLRVFTKRCMTQTAFGQQALLTDEMLAQRLVWFEY